MDFVLRSTGKAITDRRIKWGGKISEDEKVTLGNEKIDQVDSFTYLGSIISKDGESSEYFKSRIAKAQGVFSQLKKSLEEYEDKSLNQD